MRIPNKTGTPEAHLVCPTGEIETEAIYCALFRAQAVLDLLHSKFYKDGESPDQVVIYALDAVAGYLDQINILMSEA